MVFTVCQHHRLYSFRDTYCLKTSLFGLMNVVEQYGRHIIRLCKIQDSIYAGARLNEAI